MPPQIFILLSPTASGKTQLAIDLANDFDLEIINADAYQVFKAMDIGTAKPSLAQRHLAPHHMFDIATPDQTYSAHEFARDAHACVKDILSRGKRPLLVGGSGFYMRAFLTPTSDLPKGTADIKNHDQAYQQIVSQDPDLALHIHANDHYRIERASFLLSRNILPSQAWQAEKDQQIDHPHTVFSIQVDRALLYERINQRVLEMFDHGLVKETQAILKTYPTAHARLSKTIGYAQVIAYLGHQITHDDLVSLVQQKTRNYAKRQLTWIRNQLDPVVIDFKHALKDISCYIAEQSL